MPQHSATALSCLPTVKVSLLCPHHLLFTKAHTRILKQKNNSIMRLAACALSFWFTILAPHWKDPYTGGGKNTLKSLASTRIIKVSFPLNKLLWDLMQLIWVGNTNKQTNKQSLLPFARVGCGEIEPVPSLLKSSTKLMVQESWGAWSGDNLWLITAIWTWHADSSTRTKQKRHVFNLGRLSPLCSLPVKNTKQERVSLSACSAQHPHNSLAYTTGPSPGTQIGALFLHMLKKIKKGKDSSAIQ